MSKDGKKYDVWAGHGAVSRMSLGLHSNNTVAEWIHPTSGERLNRERFQDLLGVDPLNGKDPEKDVPEDISYLTPDPLTSMSEGDPPPAPICWNGFIKGDEYSVSDLEAYAENFYQEAPVTLDEFFCTEGDFKVVTIALVHFNPGLTHKDTPRFQMAKSFLQEVLPCKPDIIAGDLIIWRRVLSRGVETSILGIVCLAST